MNVTRRQILKATALGSAYFFAGGWREVLAAERRPVLVLLTGVGPDTPASVVFSVLDPIVSQNIPVGLVVRFSDAADNVIDTGSELAGLLRKLVSDYRGLIEVIVQEPDLDIATPYFRMRKASEARAAYCRVIGSALCAGSGLTIASVADSPDTDRIDGVRAAGFRNMVILPKASAPSDYWETEVGVLQIRGGTLLATGDGAAVSVLTEAPVGGDAPSIIVLDISAGFTDEKQAFDFGAGVGDALAVRAMSGELYATLPVEMHARTGRAYGRIVGLLVEAPAEDDTALREFVSRLKAAKVPFSLAGRDCAIAPDGRVSVKKVPAGATVCAGNAPDIAALAKAGVAMVSAPEPGGFSGLDRFGVFHAPVTFSFDGASRIRTPADARADLVDGAGTLRDVVVSVTSLAVQDDKARESLLALFTSMDGAGDGDPVSLEQFMEKAAPQGEVYSLLKSMHHARSFGEIDKVDFAREAYLEDARLAWRFFERMIDPETGLCPGSADFYDGEVSVYPFTTMWDIGTQIMATIGAWRLGVIDTAKFDALIGRVLANLPTVTLSGLRLPAATVSTTGKDSNEEAFDASDLGRLLVAFRMLQNHRGDKFDLPSIVQGWDIDGILEDGRLYSVRNGKPEPLEDSNYAHYAMRGFALWGFEAKEPYRIPAPYTDFDAEVAVLGIAAQNGLISTEPHGLEGIEMGYSAPSRVIADTLYALQLAEHEKTGAFVSVSEGTLNREPWFTYQGYQIGAENPWQVKTIENLARYRTAGFQRATAMTSVKAAYLWAALRPQTYSRDLVHYIREKARIEDLGFAPGVFLATKTAMANYSDVNTNGVILQALAYMDAGGVPLLDLADNPAQ